MATSFDINNNSYYKLDENILSIIPYKDIAKDIFE